MANVTLKSLQLPGLSNTYTVPQVDNTLTQPGRPADAKKTGDEIATINTALTSKASTSDLTAETTAREAADEALTGAIASKASTDGSYEGMTVGSSEQLLSDSYTEDKVPYLFRASGGNGADREYDEIVGGTVAWNQLSKFPSVTSSSGGVTFVRDFANGTITANGTSTGGAFTNGDTVSGVLNHVIYVCGCPSGGSDSTYYCSDGYEAGLFDTGSGLLLKKASKDTSLIQIVVKEGVTVTNVVFKPQIFDLTAMFGTTIADYIYSLETATAGAGVAFFRKLFPKDYYPYDAGSLKSVEGLSAHEMVGFNQFDKETATVYKRYLQNIDGTNYAWTSESGSSSIAIRCFPNTQYCVYVNGLTPNILRVGAITTENLPTGSEQVPLEKVYANSTTGMTLYTTGANAKWLIVQSNAVTFDNVKDNLCINLSDPSKNGTYEPYVKHTYPLDDSLTLRGIPKLDSNNNLYFDGDTYEADGTVTRRYGVVDLGTLTWSTAGSGRHNASPQNLNPVANTSVANMLCVKYKTTSGNVVANEDNSIGVLNNTQIQINDSTLNGADAAAFKTAMSGVYLVYELATPTTESTDPFQNPQIVDPYGTEEYVSTGIVPVGHDTKYPDNLKSKIEGLPWNFATLIAPTEATYKATQNYTTGALFIVSNILYKATANIANGGTITPGTNCQATTLAEVISALA